MAFVPGVEPVDNAGLSCASSIAVVGLVDMLHEPTEVVLDQQADLSGGNQCCSYVLRAEDEKHTS